MTIEEEAASQSSREVENVTQNESDEEDEQNEEYEPTYYCNIIGLPPPEGIFGKELQAAKTPQAQFNDASAMLRLITDQDQSQFYKLGQTSAPMPVLVKVPGTCRVKLLLGLAPFLQDPFNTQSSVDGKFLALREDIDDPTEAPTVLTFPTSIMTIKDTRLPTIDQFHTKIIKNDDSGEGNPWFKQSKVNHKEKVAKIAPCPAFLAYDALMDEVEAHVIWERLQCSAIQPDSTVFLHLSAFLRAVHVDHTASNTAVVDVGAQIFMARQHKDAKTWAKATARKLFPQYSATTTTQTSLPGSPAPTQPDLQLLAQAMLAARPSNGRTTPPLVVDSTTKIYDTYGLCEVDMERVLTMCGRSKGQEDMLPEWIQNVAVKNINKDGKRSIIRKLLTTELKYEEHPIPLTPTLLQMIINKEFGGDDDTTTATGAMKGLSPYTMAIMSSEELEEANEYAQAVEESKSASVADIRKKHNPRAQPPHNFTNLLEILKTFANLLQALFGRRCYFLKELLGDVIVPLLKFTPIARKLMAKHTLASILWAVFKQCSQFTLGMMGEDSERMSEWDTAITMIKCKSDFKLLDVPLTISGADIKSSQKMYGKRNRVALDEDSDTPEDTTKRGGKSEGRGDKTTYKAGTKIKIHPLIKSQITATLPDRFTMKALTKACNVHPSKVFPSNPKICLHGALRGFCPFSNCRLTHDPELITDELADHAITTFAPFIENPSILAEGK